MKDLLFQLPELPAKGWEELNDLMEQPCDAKQTKQWVRELKALLKSDEDKHFALYALQRVVNADGVVTEHEKQFLDTMCATIWGKSQEWIEQLDGLMRAPLKERGRSLKPTGSSENYLEARMRRLSSYSRNPFRNQQLPSTEGMKLRLAGILMARVIRADGRVEAVEIKQVEQFLQERWDLSKEEAHYVVRTCLKHSRKRQDLIRACREFYELTDELERVAFLDVLFKVALADNVLSEAEVAEVMDIAANIKLGHHEFHMAFERFASGFKLEGGLLTSS
ncbi:MAG: hypothetical protein Tsb0018_03010 [Opitutales bacterium]